MLITGIELKALRIAAFLQFHKDILTIILRNNPGLLKVQLQYDQLLNTTQYMDSLFKKTRGSAITQTIIAQDERRDNAINGLIMVINGYAYHHHPIMRDAAIQLQFSLKPYGSGIARESYQAETSILDNIIADWTNKPELADAVAGLNLNSWVDEMAAANKEFNELYINRTQAMAAANPDSLAGQRIQAMQEYYQLRDKINAWFTIENGAAPFDKVTQECNVLIDQYNKMIAASGVKDDEEDTFQAIAEAV